ncbi:MAG: hypothetical protein ACYSW3_28275 [Planctomycetota bacterium]|jgi:hypothetical protein
MWAGTLRPVDCPEEGNIVTVGYDTEAVSSYVATGYRVGYGGTRFAAYYIDVAGLESSRREP